MVDRRESAKELIGDVGQNSGTPGGDAVLDEKCEELGEEIVVGNGRAEGAKLIESRGEIGIRGTGLAKCTVAETESGVFRHGQVTTPAGTLLAATGYRLNSALPQSVGRSKLAKRIKDPETTFARFTNPRCGILPARFEKDNSR